MHDTHGNPVGFTTSIRPSSKSQKRFLRKIRDIVHSKRTIHQAGLISLLNPIIRGWANYFATVVSKEIFQKMDMLIFRKLWAWAMRRHPNKGRKWIANKYWQIDHHGWTFKANGIITLHKLGKIPIRRHIMVGARRSPYDGDAVYWSTRTGAHPEMPRSLARLLKAQDGLCPVCGLFFKPDDRIKVVRRLEGRANGLQAQPVLVHEHCQDSPGGGYAMTTHHITEEPDEGKLSRPVLKTSMNGDVHA